MGGPINFTVVPDSGAMAFTGYAKVQLAEPLGVALALQGYGPNVTIQVLGSASVTPAAGSLIFFSPTPFNPVWAKHVNKILGPGGVPENA